MMHKKLRVRLPAVIQSDEALLNIAGRACGGIVGRACGGKEVISHRKGRNQGSIGREVQRLSAKAPHILIFSLALIAIPAASASPIFGKWSRPGN